MTPILGIWASQAIKNFLNVVKFAIFSPKFGTMAAPTFLRSSNGVDWSGTALEGETPEGFWNSVVWLSGYGYFAHSGTDNKNYQNVPYDKPNAGMMKSTDGLSWTTSGVNWHGNANAIGVVGNTSVMIAPTKYSNGKIFKSTDAGASWSSSYDLYIDAAGVAYGNGTFVITGDSNGPTFAYSTDGSTWSTTGAMEPMNTNHSVKFLPSANNGSGMFVSIASYSSTIWFSTDGAWWSQTSLPYGDGWSDVDYLNGTYMIIAGGQGSYTSIYSTSLYQGWTYASLPSYTGWSTLTNDGSNFYAFSKGGWDGGTSKAAKFDGQSWTSINLGVSAGWLSSAKNLDNNEFVVIPFFSSYDIAAGPSKGGAYVKKKSPGVSEFSGSHLSNSFSTAAYPWGSDAITWEMTYGNGIYALAYPGSTQNFYMSTDTITWTQGPAYPEGQESQKYDVGQVIFAGDKFVLNPTFSSSTYSSTDLTSWTVGYSSIFGYDNQSIAYGVGMNASTGKYVRSDGSGSVETSTDAITWSGGPSNPTQGNWSKIGFGNGKWFMLGQYNWKVSSSLDGLMWNTYDQQSLPQSDYENVYYVNGLYVAVPYSAGAATAYSTDLTTWDSVAMLNSYDYKIGKIIYHEQDAMYYAMVYGKDAAGNVMMKSTDFLTWTDITLPISGAFSTIVAF